MQKLVLNSLKLLLQIFLSLILSLILFPILTVAFLTNELTRAVLSFILRIKKSNPKIRLVPSGSDNVWHYKKPGNNRIWLVIVFCKDQINLQSHRELYSTRVINHTTPEGTKPFKKLKKTFIQKWGYHCFRQDNDFNISNHVRIYPGSETEIITESYFMSKILPELSQDMDESKPQWEEVIIPQFKYDTDDKIVTARIFRYHHGYMDGASAMMQWAACMTPEGHDGFPFPINPLKAIVTSKVKRWSTYFFCTVLASYTMVNSIYEGRTVESRYVTDNYTGQRVYAWSDKISMTDLKEIKAKRKVNLAAIISASLGAALRKLDMAFPSRHAKFQGRIQETEVIGMVNALLPYPDIHPRNHFTITHFDLPTGQIEWDARIRRTHQKMRKMASDPAIFLNFFMFKFFGRFPNFILQRFGDNGGLPITLSICPLSTRKISYWDNLVEDNSGWPALLTNTGLGITIPRYGDHMRFCCVSDVACLSSQELQFLAREVSNEIVTMAEHCRNSSHVKSPDFTDDHLKQVISEKV